MGPLRTLAAGSAVRMWAALRPWWVDAVIAVGVGAAALGDLGTWSRHEPGWVAEVACVAVGMSLVESGRYPEIGAVVAEAGLVVLALSGPHRGSGLPEEAAVVWLFFCLGRGSRRRGPVLVVLAGWLASSVVVGLSAPSGPLANGSGGFVANAVFWVVSGIIPFSLGVALSRYRAQTGRLELAADELQDGQAGHAARAADAERAKVARELHDVVAHSVSVMVVQASGARRVLASDVTMAVQALGAVETAGREALVELRRIVGALRRSDPGSEHPVAAGLANLPVLVDRAVQAGLIVDLQCDGVHPSLSAGVELTVFRLVQEGLTNAIKHAGPTTARVTISFTPNAVTVQVCDDGRTSGVANHSGSGHGLIGLHERVNLYGGTFRSGPRAGRGFEITATIPLDSISVAVPPAPASPPMRGAKWRVNLDPLIAVGFLVLLEVTTISSGVHGGARLRDVVAVAAMTSAAGWRSRHPLWFVVVVVALTLSLSSQVAPRTSVFSAIYVGLILPYTVAAWEPRSRAGVGLVILVAGSAIDQLLVHHVSVGYYAGPLFVIMVAWIAGRAVRARRGRAVALEHTTVRLAAERHHHAELAVAGERSRIARELHAVVSQNVAVMVVQAQAARAQLVAGASSADESLQAIQDTGRQALTELRRILGVLRHHSEVPELAPQPGVDQIRPLIQHWRQQGLRVDLTVSGEPNALSAGVNLAVYRILEDILAASEQRSAVAIALRFADDNIELAIGARPRTGQTWPPESVSERVRLCGGELRLTSNGDQQSFGRNLVACFPTGLVPALP